MHNDFTNIYGDALIRSFEQEDGVTFGNVDEMKAAGVTEEVMRNSRLVMVNTWRSVSDEPLQRNPLAVCDVRTVGLDELVASRLGGNADSLEVYSSMFSPEHEWCKRTDSTESRIGFASRSQWYPCAQTTIPR